MIRHNRSTLILLAVAFGLSAAHAAVNFVGTNDGLAVITAIGPGGTITATNGTRKLISFEVKDPAVLRSLRAGQQVMVNQDTGMVSVAGADNCCRIVQLKAPPPKQLAPPAR
jgi:hypothetical protein